MNEKFGDLVSKIAQCMNYCTMNEKMEKEEEEKLHYE
jgi:hypothetical protein